MSSNSLFSPINTKRYFNLPSHKTNPHNGEVGSTKCLALLLCKGPKTLINYQNSWVSFRQLTYELIDLSFRDSYHPCETCQWARANSSKECFKYTCAFPVVTCRKKIGHEKLCSLFKERKKTEKKSPPQPSWDKRGLDKRGQFNYLIRSNSPAFLLVWVCPLY